MSDEETRDRHAEYQRDHAEWLDEISRWRTDNRKAIAILKRVEADFFDIDAEMEAHAGAIRRHHLEIRHHNVEMAMGEADEGDAGRHHNEFDALHADVEEAQERLREQQRELLSDLGDLYEALADND